MNDYFLIKVIEYHNGLLNNEVYEKGKKVIAWEDKDLNVFWVANCISGSPDTIPTSHVKKIYKITFEKI